MLFNLKKQIMNKLKLMLILAFSVTNLALYGQGREKGRIKKSTVIKPDNPYYKDTEKKKDDFDFLEESTPKQILDKQYTEENIPYKNNETRSVVSVIDSTNISPTTKITEGKKDIMEVVEEIQLGETDEDWIKVADYYSVWDEKNIDPYDLKPEDFEGPVVLNLVDRSNNHFSSSPTNNGPITSKFGWRAGRRHAGVDIDIETGDPIYSAFDGIVRVVGWDGNGYGRYMVVRHYNGLETLYGHLNKAEIASNTIVKAGDMIAEGGNSGRSTGSHLHFETRYEGNPFNPTEVFVFPVGALKSEQLVLTSETFNVVRASGLDEFTAGSKIKYRKSVFYRVKRGDTLYGIAERNNLSASDLARKNKISVNGNLMAGRKLRIR
jgi:murein DD-endopeptidase MepM/ murein hydrolase activator NlpD